MIVGDLSSIDGTGHVAEQANGLGRYDAVIHNAGVGHTEPRRIEPADGLSHVFAVNVLAPYLLTALITPPNGSSPELGDAPRRQRRPLRPGWERRAWAGSRAYAD